MEGVGKHRFGVFADAGHHKPHDKPYVIVHLDVSEVRIQFDAGIIVKFINKFMGDTHAILFMGETRTTYLDEIASAVLHTDFHDIVGEVATDTFVSLIAGADAVLTADSTVFNLACTLNTPVLALYADAHPPYMPWSAGLDFEMDNPSPYTICQALTYLLSFSMKNPLTDPYATRTI